MASLIFCCRLLAAQKRIPSLEKMIETTRSDPGCGLRNTTPATRQYSRHPKGTPELREKLFYNASTVWVDSFGWIPIIALQLNYFIKIVTILKSGKKYAMEVLHFQIQLHLATAFGLIFLVMGGTAIPTTNEEQTCCGGEKYLTNTYFIKHDSLIDSQFEEFIANEIPLGLCKVLQVEPQSVPTLLSVHRNLIGEGSHRQLSSSIRIKMQGESKFKLPAQSCQVIIVERLPSGVFADPFELQHLVQRGVFTDAAVLGDTNLELPSFRSNRSVVELHVQMGSNMLLESKDALEVNLGLPLHARYAPLGHGFSKVEFGQPDLFMRCSFKGKAFSGSCLFMTTNHIVDYKAIPVVWEVPCGIKEHVGVVSAVTFLSAMMSSLLIVSTSMYHSHITLLQ
ncbi:phosphatidylinositol-glycan biosynthesis class X protein [Forsythia ovata]|uniref:Phosphatidylinositol-glycan biosynthesis class X protein n=1 Tax=Forsythia ovata TaxID=205694 RepID=A0ABD1VNV6_9LAMI